ncbi:MAG: segregation and condensation protein A [Gemmataceae bacterium]
MDYQVDLATFRGPLDLLLFLVKRHEVEIFDIPIAQVTEQFFQYLNAIQQIDVELAGEFLVMAATLMEIKSRMLLPYAVGEKAEEEDPRLELVKQLVEYRKFKDAAALLEGRAEELNSRLPREAPPEPAKPGGPPPLRPVELWDLVAAFGRLVRESLALQPTPIIVDDTPQHIYLAQIRQRLKFEPRVSFAALFQPPLTRGRLIGLFLAVLEMIKMRQVTVEQPDRFGEIWVCLREEEDNHKDHKEHEELE